MEDNTLTQKDKATLLAYTDVKNLSDCDKKFLVQLMTQKIPSPVQVSDRKRRSIFIFVTGYLRDQSKTWRHAEGIAEDELLTLLQMCLLIGYETGRKLVIPLDQE